MGGDVVDRQTATLMYAGSVPTQSLRTKSPLLSHQGESSNTDLRRALLLDSNAGGHPLTD